jgi:hypothetical protein
VEPSSGKPSPADGEPDEGSNPPVPDLDTTLSPSASP